MMADFGRLTGAGVCLPVEHCTLGFHPPVGGGCPAWDKHNGTAGGQVEVSEVLKLNGRWALEKRICYYDNT